MTIPSPTELITTILSRLQLGASAEAASASDHRWTIEGLTLAPESDGITTLRVQRLCTTNVRLAFGPFSADIGQLTLSGVTVRLPANPASKTEPSSSAASPSQTPTAPEFEATSLTLDKIKLTGRWPMPTQLTAPTPVSPSAHPPEAWQLTPLAQAEGTLRARITDAALIFDADVTVPVRRGQIDFNAATVEHVGPDSSMGVSRMGFYVDAPNGRSYLYQFAQTPLAGVELERRDPLVGKWVTDRGRVTLQPFVEAMLRQSGGVTTGWTDQALQLLARTAVEGDITLGTGALKLAEGPVRLEARAETRLRIEVQSGAVGKGLSVELPALTLSELGLSLVGWRLGADTVDGQASGQLSLAEKEWRLAFLIDRLVLQNLSAAPEGAEQGAGGVSSATAGSAGAGRADTGRADTA